MAWSRGIGAAYRCCGAKNFNIAPLTELNTAACGSRNAGGKHCRTLSLMHTCAGFGGFVPYIPNQVGLTYSPATHKALNEFTDMLLGVGVDDYADCYDTGPAAMRAKKCPLKVKHDEHSCHAGCSPEPPRRCQP